MENQEKDTLYKMGHPNSGFRVAYEVRECEYGVGLFATEDIPEGTMLWEYMAGKNVIEFDEASLKEHLSKMTFEQAQNMLIHSYGSLDVQCQILDEGLFWNHSKENANCTSKPDPDPHTYAKRDIVAGEQLLDDYTTFHFPDFVYPLREQYKVVEDFYEKPPRKT